MKIESVDFFYLSMPEVLDIGDGSQDALLVRVRAGGFEGWGECEAAPLPSIAAWMCPRSHSACKPVADSVLGQTLDDVAHITRIGNLVRENSLDLLQADHTLSGVDIALWDLLGKKLGQPVYRLLGYAKSFPKTPYASVLFGDTPQETLQKGRAATAAGYRAAKFGWGPFGRTTVAADREQLHAAREGLGPTGLLLVDAGTVWVDNVTRAAQVLPALHECRALWLEEPFVSGALEAYSALAAKAGSLKLAGGEGSHNIWMARQMMQHGDVGYIQIDCGRIGGISVAKQAADDAVARGVTFVNHTFTSHLALSASLQPFAGLEKDVICEYPVEPKPLAVEMTSNHLKRDPNGQVRAPATPGLGITPDLAGIKKYLVPVEIKVRGEVLYHTPEL
ncbi:MAG: mandelate racemase/muconate lactonizing enzyme family protein [Opitutaceae bacterium]|nr:mandelate racemase/muconate lactonizing enzyme family protein [Opitutaceae bacterium]MBP9911866.1 mandelate racemase/muconate lactonizing enzyme family protein [Opitutaceae bacterium]